MAPPESDAIHFSVHQESVVGRSTSDPLPEKFDLISTQCRGAKRHSAARDRTVINDLEIEIAGLWASWLDSIEARLFVRCHVDDIGVRLTGLEIHALGG